MQGALGATAVALCLIVSTDVEGKDFGLELAQAFVGNCLQQLPNISAIEQAAIALKWRSVPQELLPLLAPEDSTAKWKSWSVVPKDDGPSYLIGTSEAVLDGKRTVTCGVVHPRAPYEEVVPKLQRILGLGPPKFVDREPAQRISMWQLEMSDRRYGLVVTDMTPLDKPGLNLSAFVAE